MNDLVYLRQHLPGTELFQGRAVVERQHQVLVRLLEPRPDKRLQFVGILLSQVLRLGAIYIDMVELPCVFVEMAFAAQWRMEGNRLPAILPKTASAQHGKVLPLLLG